MKKLTQGSMLLALCGLVLIIDNTYAGLISGIIPFVMPIPIVIYTTNYGIKDGTVFYACFVILCFLLSPILGFILGIIYGLCGLLIGIGFYQKQSPAQILLISTLSLAISYIFLYFVFGAITGLKIEQELAVSTDLFRQLIPNFEMIEVLIPYLFFGVLSFVGYMEGYVIFKLTQIILNTLKIQKISKVNIRHLSIPKIYGYLMTAGLFGFGYWFKQTGNYLFLYVCSILYVGLILLGLLYFHRSQKYARFKVVSYLVFIFTFSFLCVFHAGVGLLTLLLDKWK